MNCEKRVVSGFGLFAFDKHFITFNKVQIFTLGIRDPSGTGYATLTVKLPLEL